MTSSAVGAKNVVAVQAYRRCDRRHTALTRVVLAQQLLAFHQRRHGQVAGKTVSDVLQAFPTGSLLFIHDDTAAKRTVRLGFGL